MVTHELALAEKHAGRMVHLADGKLVHDVPNHDLPNDDLPNVSATSSEQQGETQ
jgi:ABC-type phosphate/phosphonate transport system ATPase subunit